MGVERDETGGPCPPLNSLVPTSEILLTAKFDSSCHIICYWTYNLRVQYEFTITFVFFFSFTLHPVPPVHEDLVLRHSVPHFPSISRIIPHFPLSLRRVEWESNPQTSFAVVRLYSYVTTASIQYCVIRALKNVWLKQNLTEINFVYSWRPFSLQYFFSLLANIYHLNREVFT